MKIVLKVKTCLSIHILINQINISGNAYEKALIQDYMLLYWESLRNISILYRFRTATDFMLKSLAFIHVKLT